MRLAILHHHLNQGGVTHVILNQLQALNDTANGDQLEVTILFGGRHAGVEQAAFHRFPAIEVSLVPIPALDYDTGTQPDDSALADDIQAALDHVGFRPGEALLHVHNHSLGKNISLPGAIRRLAERGFQFLLQIHDFAEDLRPANYRRLASALASGANPADVIYPQGSHIHYACLNSRDLHILGAAGVPEDRLHFLPNAVREFQDLPPRQVARERLLKQFEVPIDHGYVIYPVRGIRRKNVGELLLWSALRRDEAVFGITLPALNPVEQTSYKRWVELAEQLRLPCVFHAGGEQGLAFLDNLSAADAILTTSVAEGFGMVFLEAWLAGRPLIGRDLPEITADFRAAGVEFQHLYERLLIPTEYAHRASAEQALTEAYRQLFEEYDEAAAFPPDQIQSRISALLEADTVDFAVLDSASQARVIQRVSQDEPARQRILELNPAVRTLFDSSVNDAAVERNADVVRTAYSVAGCGSQLRQLYRDILRSPTSSVEPLPNSKNLLATFLDVERLHPIRFES